MNRWLADLRTGKVLLFNALTVIVLHIVGVFAFQFVTVNDVTPVWPMSGISLAALLISRFRLLPGVIIGYWVLDAHLYESWSIGMVMGMGEILEAVIAALLILRWNGRRDRLYNVRSTFLFAIAVSLAPILNATLGTSLLYFRGSVPAADYISVWRTWWTADTVGFLVFAPFLLSWRHGVKGIHSTLPKIGELLLLVGLTTFISWQTFGMSHPLEYMFLLPMVWAAFRFGQRGSTLLVVCLSLVSIFATAQDVGIFAANAPSEAMVLLQSFVGVVSLTILIVLSTINQQEIAEQRLKQANELLESRVAERTAELSQTLIDLQKMQTQLVQTEKMSSLGQLVAGVAHEINNPVNFIHGNLAHTEEYAHSLLDLVDLYQQYYPEAEPAIQIAIETSDLPFLRQDFPKILQSMRVGAERIREIVKSLRNFSRLDEAEFKAVDIHEGLDSTLMILQNRLKKTVERPDLEVVKSYSKLPRVECYPGQLNQVFMNILSNAIDALDSCDRMSDANATPTQPGTISISTEMSNPDWVTIRIADNGPGMAEDVRSKLFDPFFTTKPIGKGTGLGLSISYQIVTEKHHGKLLCHSTLGQGTEFVLEIPVHQAFKPMQRIVHSTEATSAKTSATA
ncbi:MAG: MASE1 domain-containing protein [Thainema sp.]